MSGGERQRSISVLGFLPKPEDDLNPFVVSVSPLFFETMGIPLSRGRAFTPADEPNASRVAIVNASFARYYFGSDDALGRRFGFGAAESDQVEIVGVAQDSRLNDLLEKPPHVVYVPASAVFSNTVLAVRYEGDALGMATTVTVDVVRKPTDRNLWRYTGRGLALADVSFAFGASETSRWRTRRARDGSMGKPL